MTPAAFATIAVIHLIAAASPGPSFVICVRTAANEGFGTAVALAIGFGLGAVLWAAAALTGLALLFEAVPQMFIVLKLIGGGFLIFIGVMMWRHAPDPLPKALDNAPRSRGAAIRFGFVTFAANPKTAVFFGAVFVGLIPSGTALSVLVALLLVIFVNEVVWYTLVARIFSASGARAAYTRLKTWIDRGFGSLLAVFGARIAQT